MEWLDVSATHRPTRPITLVRRVDSHPRRILHGYSMRLPYVHGGLTRPGLASITLTNADTLAVAQPAMDGRTSKLLAEAAWDGAGAATALSKALLEG